MLILLKNIYAAFLVMDLRKVCHRISCQLLQEFKVLPRTQWSKKPWNTKKWQLAWIKQNVETCMHHWHLLAAIITSSHSFLLLTHNNSNNVFCSSCNRRTTTVVTWPAWMRYLRLLTWIISRIINQVLSSRIMISVMRILLLLVLLWLIITTIIITMGI